MTEQEQPPQQTGPQITTEQLHAATGSRYGLIIGQSTVEILELKSLLTEAKNRLVQAVANENELQRQIAQLTAGAVAYESRIRELEKELEVRPTAEQVADLEAKLDDLIAKGPTVGHTAARDLAKMKEREEKAARK